jgi:hypothetical protein
MVTEWSGKISPVEKGERTSVDEARRVREGCVREGRRSAGVGRIEEHGGGIRIEGCYGDVKRGVHRVI